MDNTVSPNNAELKNDPMVKFVVEEMERYESFHQERFDEAVEIYDFWTNKAPTKSFDWMNAVHIPMTFEGEQTITPRLFAALFPTEAPIEVKVFGDTPEEQGIVIKGLIEQHFRMSDVQGESLSALTQCSLYGTGYVEAPWLFRRSWIIGPDGSRHVAVIDNRPDCKAVNFFEMYPHPAKMRMSDELPIIRRRFCDAEYLKGLSDNPNFKFENLQEALNSQSVVSKPSTLWGPDGKTVSIKKRDEFEILEYWGPYDLTYLKDEKPVVQKAVPHWIIIINRAVKVRGVPNPYNHQRPPFCKLKLYEDAKPGWFGIGIGKVGKPTQERLNKIVNQRLDNVDLVLNKQGFYNGNDTLINTKKLQVSKPGQWHKVSDTVTSIRWMDTPDVTASSYKEEELAKNDFRESTGATVSLMPTDEGQHRTAMGINLLQGAAGIRFRTVLKRLETDFIQDLAFMYLSNLQQFMTMPEWVTITSSNGTQKPVMVSPEQIQSKVKFIPTGISEALNKEFAVGQLLRFKELTMNDPTVNRQEINKRIAEQMGFKDISKLLVQQQPVMMGQDGGQAQLQPQEQQRIQQRIAEGATPQQIKMEMLGNPPAPDQGAQGGQ